ncbi:MAG: dimethylmenaquinone methyltransferase [Chloroflexi bacterium]|nr:dimethylmenaquinone methyltransferase [Chloroflexota bacterium]
MSDNQSVDEILALQKRWDRLRIANIYDVLDAMGYGNQVLDLGIRPLLPHQHLAGVALTVRGARDMRTAAEVQADSKQATTSFVGVGDLIRPGCVVVVDTGGERWAGKFGEMTSWRMKQQGAMGVVMDGYIRDYLGLIAIPGWTVCVRGTTPIEGAGRWRVHATDVSIGLPGTLTNTVRVDPGDWVIGGADGVIVVPQAIAMDVLVKAEELEAKEQGMRADLSAGISFTDAYAKWGRA